MPLAPLPSVLREDFNENLQQETWPEVYGAERGTLSGEPLKSGTALIFKGVGVFNVLQKTFSVRLQPQRIAKLNSLNCLFAGWSADDCVTGSGLHKHSLHPILIQIHH